MKKDEKEKRKASEPRDKSKLKTAPPKELSDEAKKEWRTLMNYYKNLDLEVICNLDRNALTIYCENMALYKKAVAEIAKGPEVYLDFKGNLKKTPWLDVKEKATNKIKTFGEMLLLDPQSRAKMGTAAKKKAEENKTDDMEDFLKINPRDL